MNHQLEISEESKNAEKAIDLMKSNEHNKFVLYYARWCGHCKSFMPQWNMMCKKITAEHPNLDVKLVKVDCEYVNGREEEKLGHNPNVRMYPTLRVYRKQSNPEQSEDYEEQREPTSILNYLSRNFSSETPPKKKSLKKKNSKKDKEKNKKKASALGKKKKKSKRGKKGRKSGGAMDTVHDKEEIETFLQASKINTSICDFLEKVKNINSDDQITKIYNKLISLPQTGVTGDKQECIDSFKLYYDAKFGEI